jgi:hypothetical protein
MGIRFSKLERGHKITFALLVGFAVIAFWRGVWGLLDIYLYPNNPELSFWTSIAIGLFILVATHYAVKELI